MKNKKLFVFVALLVLASQTCLYAENGEQVKRSHILYRLFPGIGIEESYIGARLGSYKPDLRQLDAILKEFRAQVPGASTMFNIYTRFKGSSQLSYLLELSYWDNESSLKPFTDADIGATFTQASLSLLYYPETIQKLLPLYIGFGGGIANLKLYGSALELLKEIVTKRDSTELSGNFIIGLEYVVLDRVVVDIQATHIFKNFQVDDEGEYKFSFDGTVMSLGASMRF
jgi:hypothetical protein